MTDLQAQAVAAEEAKKKVLATYGPTARMAGESVEEYAEMRRRLEEQANRTPQKFYYEDNEVAKLAAAKLKGERTAAYTALIKSLPEPIALQFKKGEDEPRNIDGLPHLASAILGKMTLLDKDGSKSLVHVCLANFTPGAIDPEEHRFVAIPDQRGKTSKDNKPTTYLIGRKINPDGSLGPIDPRFAAENGSAKMTSKLGEVQKELYEIGKNNIAIIKQQREEAARAKAAPATSETSQILQGEKARILAVQAQLRAQGQGHTRQQPEQDVGRSLGR
ncbi:hypothetical protein [Agrobacterium fabrum]|nr:hypothetical protein [Agrobacterium fabrum]